MSDTSSAAGPPVHNAPALSVSEVSAALKRTIEDAFGFVRVRGEISQPKVASSGHCYLRLKDENANLDAIIWRGSYSKLGLKPEEGMEVIASGRLTTYPGRSSYQLVIESMELAGQGALLKLLEERRRKLAAEGLFDEARKKPLPVLPVCIGVVTSPTGAVIRDILHRIADRFPRRVLLWPVKVQGEGSAAEVAAVIAGFNALDGSGPIAAPGRGYRRARRRKLGRLVGVQRRGCGACGRGLAHSPDRRRGPRDRLDPDRSRRRPARAHAHRCGGDGRARAPRSADAHRPVRRAAVPGHHAAAGRRPDSSPGPGARYPAPGHDRGPEDPGPGRAGGAPGAGPAA